MHRRLIAFTAATLMTTTIGGATLAAPASAKTRKPSCNPGVQFTKMRSGFVKSWGIPINNRTSEPATQSVTVNKSRKVDVDLSASLEAEAKANGFVLSATVKTQFGVSYKTSVTTAVGVTSRFTARPFHRVNVRYGAVTRVFTGMLLIKRGPVVGPNAFPGCDLIKFASVRAEVPTGDEGFDAVEQRLKRKKG